jgi:uncharacterized protein
MRIIVFAKAPVPGAAKTRLIPALGPQSAARVHEWLVERALETACAAGLGPVELWCAPDRAHPFFAGCAARFDVSLTDQGAGGLGERMHRALAAGLPAILIGADCPAMTPEYLCDGAGALAAGYDVVLGPAEDGGYVLVGANRIRPDAFARICWGGPDVMAEQQERLRSIGWRWKELALLWDVDRPDDLERVRREVPGGAARLNALTPREGAGEIPD